METIPHPQMDIAIMTLRLEISKRGRPNVPCHPISAGSSQRELNAPIPKELGLPSLEGRISRSQNRKKESKIALAKRQRKEKACEHRTKERVRTRVRTSGEAKSPPGQPSLHRAGSEGGGKKKKKHIKREAKIEPLSSLCFFWVGLPSHLEDVFSFACQIKLSCN